MFEYFSELALQWKAQGLVVAGNKTGNIAASSNYSWPRDGDLTALALARRAETPRKLSMLGQPT